MSPICMREVTDDITTTSPATTTTTNFDDSVTLEGGDGYSYGNVFAINRNGYYGPVCDDGWSSSTAHVVCRYRRSQIIPHCSTEAFLLGHSVSAFETFTCEKDWPIEFF